MPMHDPPHPGEFLAAVYLEPNALSARELAAKLGVSASTSSRILRGTSVWPRRWLCASRRRSDGSDRGAQVTPSARSASCIPALPFAISRSVRPFPMPAARTSAPAATRSRATAG